MLFLGCGLKIFSPLTVSSSKKKHYNSYHNFLLSTSLKGTQAKANAVGLLRLNIFEVNRLLIPKKYDEHPHLFFILSATPRKNQGTEIMVNKTRYINKDT